MLLITKRQTQVGDLYPLITVVPLKKDKYHFFICVKDSVRSLLIVSNKSAVTYNVVKMNC